MSLIAMFALGIFTVPHAFAPTSTLTAPMVDDTGIVSDGDPTTAELSIDLSVTNVVALVAFNLYVYYDTSVLTAVDAGGYYPFDYPLPMMIDDANGKILMGASFPPPELVGKTVGMFPFPVAHVDFSVDGLGASMLDIEGAVFADVNGVELSMAITDGWFRNVDGVPIAWFAPMDPEIGEAVTFTSTSIDPEGTIDAFDWDWGDGTAHGTTETATHAWTAEGTYAVTLTVTDNDANTDGQARSIEITPPPPAGAIAIRGLATSKYLDYTKFGSHHQWLKGWVKNIDPTRTELIRVDLDVYSAVYGLKLGSVITPNQWLGPGVLGTFQGLFDMMDPKWMFVQGAARTGFDEFTVVVNVFYADFFYNDDPNLPHWTQLPDAPIVSYTFGVHETKAVPVPVATQTGPGTVFADGTGSYDVDEKWGDAILGYRWIVYDIDGNIVYLVFGETYTFNLDPGYYDINLRVEDSFGTRRSAWTDITVV